MALDNNFSDPLNTTTTNLVLKYVTQRVDRPFALTDTLANITKNETVVNILLSFLLLSFTIVNGYTLFSRIRTDRWKNSNT